MIKVASVRAVKKEILAVVEPLATAILLGRPLAFIHVDGTIKPLGCDFA